MRNPYLYFLVAFNLMALTCQRGVKEHVANGLYDNLLEDEIDALYQRAYSFLEADNFDSARFLFGVTDSLADAKGYNGVKVGILTNLAWMHTLSLSYDSAHFYYDKAISSARELGDSIKLSRNIRQKALVFRRQNNFSESAATYESAFDLSGLVRDSSNMASSANGLGTVLIELLDYENALKYFKVAGEIWEQIGSMGSSSIAIHNQGDALRGMGRLDEALETYKTALKLKRDLNRTSSSAYTLTGMGRTYLLMDSIDRAEEVLQEAIDIRSKLRNKNSYAESLLIMSRVSVARRQYRKAERQLKEVEQIARVNNKADLLRDAFEDQRTLYKKWGKLAELAAVDEHYDIMTDSLYREEKLKVQEVQAAADLQREQQRTQLAEQNARLAELERDAEQQKGLFRLVLAIVAIIGLLVIGWQLLQIRKRNAILLALNARIKLITDNAFHSQKNALGLISSMMRSKARQAQSKEELEVLQDVEGKIEALGGVSKYLFQRRIEDNTAVAARIKLKSYLEDLVEDTFSSVVSNADLDIEVEDIETTSTEALNVGLITNEAVTNFSKYAETQGAETLMIRVLKKAEALFLSFIDDGPGFPDGFDFSSSTGFGMQMMANLVEDMEGTIQLKREDDLTQIDIRIPLKS